MDEIVVTLFRTLIVFLVLVILFRFMGKKELGEISLLDVIVSLLVAELAVISIEDTSISMVKGFAPVFLLIFLQGMLGTIGLKNQSFHKLVEGTPIIMIEKGEIVEENLRKQGLTLADILFQLRRENVSDLREVEYAILERSGVLSVFKKGDNSFTLPLVLDGEIQENNLEIVNKTKNWLITELQKIGYSQMENILYCSYMNEEFHIQKKEHGA
ncbi:Uncharacterized membrane protein YcaP, DUF421 family [Terribacillus aidingensis]|uniref:Uncharacterized membrane protein YcaP, DUF421 family n=1 Tax=Terribacillus aidingensis TaxID=586416 RepID=A0A285NKZ5_9BACI|nr:DUF421 domain-containing protein [Terribacillus aidingensis]SNZ10162.1 Uncharacterized membrane protein YcaP, DUF421 family [Terribacillus aidingensis]